ncbi:MAG: multicopper oxidase domain-containing protein [Burkholderiales bacterium]
MLRALAGLAALGPVRLAADNTLPDDCKRGSDFAQPLAIAKDRLPLGEGPVALRATARGDGLAFVSGDLVNPMLVAAPGTQATIDVVNALGEPTSVHWHGLSVDTRNDGNGESPIVPGATFRYAFAVRNRASLYWYHPHPHGATARQMHRGLFGAIAIEDDDEHALRRALALDAGETELTLVLQDRRAGDADRYAPAPEDELLGWFGCLPHVNGVLRPHHDVARRLYRLRILNASNARTYRLALRDDRGAALAFHLAGTDGGLLERALPCREVLVSPAERVDLLVDFAGLAQGGYAILETRPFAPMQDVPRAAVESLHGHAPIVSSLPDGAAFDLMQFRVRGSASAAARLPARLSALPAVVEGSEERPLRLGFAKGRWRINDRVYDTATTNIDVARGASETWLLRNYHTSAPHAMHLHGFHFRVTGRETSPDAIAAMAVDDRGRLPTDLGLKDTVLVWPGESVRIAIDFRMPYPDAQVYLVHCHNLEHEDAGMMLRVRVA